MTRSIRLWNGPLLGAVLVCAAVIPAPAGAAGARPAERTTPSSGATAELYGVSCTSPSSCMAVGYVYPNAEDTLAEYWNGKTWSVLSSPSPGQENWLEGVSCMSASHCMAVGSYLITPTGGTPTAFPLAESWNGKTWSISKTPPLDSGGNFYSVSCTSNSRCMAVGTAEGPTLAESWNGNTWSILQTPFLSYAAGGVLDSISCPSASFCIAVGAASLSSGGSGLAEFWNG